MTQPPHYFTAPPTDPFPCSRHVIQLRPLYNCLCHLASVVHSWFMDKMRAVIHSLGDQAYLILSGAFNSPGWALQSGIWWTMAMIFHLFRPGHSRVGIKSPIWDYFCKQMQLFHSVHTLTPAPWINCKCHMLQFCLTSLFLRTFAKSHFPFSSKQRQRYSVAEKQCLMEQPKKQLSQADLEVGCTSFSPPTVRVHHCLGCSSQKWQQRVTLKGPQVQQPEKSLGWLWQNATKEEGRGFDKTTTLKCSRSLRQTQKKCTSRSCFSKGMIICLLYHNGLKF